MKDQGNTRAGRAAELARLRQRILELEKAEAEHQQGAKVREEHFRLLAENSTDMISRHDLAGVYRYVSPACRALLGYEPEEMLGQPAQQFIHPADLARIEQSRRRVIDLPAADTTVFRLRRKDGAYTWVEASSRVVRDEASGELIEIQVSTRDISDRKRAEDALRQSEELLAAAFRLLPDMIHIDDLQSEEILEVNDAFLQATGYSRGEVIGSTIAKLRLWEDSAALERLWEWLRSAGRIRSFEVLLQDRCARPFWAEISTEPITYAGRPCLITTTRDITGRKRAEQELKQALAEKETLLRELYHRTRNNMQVIVSMLSLQAAQMDDPGAEVIFRETRNRIQAMALVHQMLYQAQDLSRVDLQRYLADLARLLLQSYGPAGDRVALELDLAAEHVLIDVAIPCGLILNELVSNAMKYAFPGGRSGTIHIRLARIDPQTLELSFSDDGAGAPPGFDYRRQDTLGFTTIIALTEHQLQGQASLEANGGMTWRLRFCDGLYTERV